jgi:hypothetical protein
MMSVSFTARIRRWWKARDGGPRPKTIQHVWTPEDRQRQLRALESLCNRMADLFRANGDWYAAGLFRERAAMARRLLAYGYTQEDLNAVGASFPYGADWLHPRHPEFDDPRAPWQEQVASLHDHAAAVALDIRSIATLSE